MISLTKIMIILTQIVFGSGLIIGAVVATPLFGLLAFPLAILVTSPIITLWLIVTTAWEKFMKEEK